MSCQETPSSGFKSTWRSSSERWEGIGDAPELRNVIAKLFEGGVLLDLPASVVDGSYRLMSVLRSPAVDAETLRPTGQAMPVPPSPQ